MQPETYGLIGKKLGHSFSQSYFTKKFEALQLDHQYLNFELSTIQEFPELIRIQNPAGLNVTLPYKKEVIPYLDELDPVAEEIGAVNTIKLENDRMIGYNTDAFGFRQAIKPFLKSQHERALILGSGGASEAVNYVLQQIGLDCYTVSRNPENKQLDYQQLNKELMAGCLLIVNATPVGMHPDTSTAPNIPYEHLSDRHLLIDLIYNPEETLFLKKGKQHGAATLNGLSMLKQQAERSWAIWSNSI